MYSSSYDVRFKAESVQFPDGFKVQYLDELGAKVTVEFETLDRAIDWASEILKTPEKNVKILPSLSDEGASRW